MNYIYDESVFLRFATPTSHSKPEPKSQAAAGMGTTLV